jgi:hypothetical protein
METKASEHFQGIDLSANEVNADSLKKYLNHFSPDGMDLFALPNEQAERRDFYSLMGVGGNDLEAVRKIAPGCLVDIASFWCQYGAI